MSLLPALLLTFGATPAMDVLVFSKTAGFRHDSIESGQAALRELGPDHGFSPQFTEDAARFTDEELKPFRVVVFLNTTGDVLDETQQAVFERWVRAGGGYVGVHSASDTEYDWPFYGELVGGYFKSHPPGTYAADVHLHGEHPTTKGLPQVWRRTDEWYDFRANPRPNVTVLATLDEKSYGTGGMGDDHPIMWCHERLGGRAWYTGGGHTKESYAEPEFRRHLAAAIRWTAKADE